MNFTTLIAPEIVVRKLSEPGWVVVDCRFRLDEPTAGREAYLKAHVPGAVYADLDEHLSSPPRRDEGRHPLPDLDSFRKQVGEWGIDGATQVVCYDDAGGMIASRLWWMLRYLGHAGVAVMDGGWQAWLDAGYPTTSGEERNPATTFHGEPRPELLATLEEVSALVHGGGREGEGLLDARARPRYRGDFEPLDRVPGHIPGARNRPYNDNLDESGTMHPAEELATDFREVLGTWEPTGVIHYCGSGVSACHNILAMEHAGLSGSRLFVPSWSGWSSDPERPVETGDSPA